MSLHNLKLSVSRGSLLLSLSFILILSQVSTQSVDVFREVYPLKTFAITKSAGYFEADLGYKEAFEVNIKSYDGVEGATGSCETYPATIAAKSEWSINNPFDEVGASYDNIVYYEGYYFILDSISYTLLVTNDVTDEDAYEVYESDFSNKVDENGDYDEPFMIVGSNGFLYIINKEGLFSLDLKALIKSIEEDAPMPDLKMKTPEHSTMIFWNAVHADDLLYISTTSGVAIYETDSEGIHAKVGQLDNNFFGVKIFGSVDIVIKGKYAFVLDMMNGLFVVDVSTYKTTGKFTYLPELTLKIQKARFIEIIGNSVNIISTQARNPHLNEYIIQGDYNHIEKFIFNRKTEMYQQVRDTYSDGNFLYIITGFMNMVFRPNVTSKYDTANVTDYIANYWALFGLKSMVSVTKGSKSVIMALNQNHITMLNFQEAKPFISCSTTNMKEGIHKYQIHALQTTCPAKEKNLLGSADSFNVICEVEETILLLVASDPNSIGNVTRSNQILLALSIGLGCLTVLVIIFICFARKYKSQYRVLEDQIKFERIEEDPVNTAKTQMKTDAELATQIDHE